MKIGCVLTIEYPGSQGRPRVSALFFARLRGGKLIWGRGESGLKSVLAEVEDDEMRAWLEAELNDLVAALRDAAFEGQEKRVRADLDIDDDGTMEILVEGFEEPILAFSTVAGLRALFSPSIPGAPMTTIPHPSKI